MEVGILNIGSELTDTTENQLRDDSKPESVHD